MLNLIKKVDKMFKFYFSIYVLPTVMFVTALIILRHIISLNLDTVVTTAKSSSMLFDAVVSMLILTLAFPKLLHYAVKLYIHIRESEKNMLI